MSKLHDVKGFPTQAATQIILTNNLRLFSHPLSPSANGYPVSCHRQRMCYDLFSLVFYSSRWQIKILVFSAWLCTFTFGESQSSFVTVPSFKPLEPSAHPPFDDSAYCTDLCV